MARRHKHASKLSQLDAASAETAGMDQDELVVLNRVRRVAERQGFRLESSRRKDPLAAEYRRYRLADAFTGEVVVGQGDRWAFTMSIEEIEEWLRTPPRDRKKD